MSFVKQPETYDYYIYEVEGAVKAKIEFDPSCDPRKFDKKYEYNFRVVLFAKPEECDAFGMPLPEMKEKYENAEADLIALMQSKKVHCWLVARMTYAGMRELIFQTEGKLGFYVNAFPWIKKCGMEAELLESEGWYFFDEKVWPDDLFQRQIADRKKVNQLIASGKKLGEEIKLFYLFTGTAETLDLLWEELKEGGFSIEEGSSSYMILSKMVILDEKEVFRLSHALIEFCADLGIVFEVWGNTITEIINS